jgi:hypothetical protein
MIARIWRGATRAEEAGAHDRTVFYDEDDGFLLERDDHVSHFEVVHRDEPARIE